MEIRRAFTLIELMIAITIVVILTMATYAPYSYYQNKAKLKVTTREISQLLSESRNMAVNGAVGNIGNISIGVYFDTSVSERNKIKVFSYPYNINNVDISYVEGVNVKLIKTVLLKDGIQFNNINGLDNILFVFDSISGDIKYYNWNIGNRRIINNNIIAINFSYKGSTSGNLNKTINYFTNTNVIDYE